MTPLRLRHLIIVVFLFALRIDAQLPSPHSSDSPSPRPPACLAPEFRQFDFFLGHWKVTNPKGVQVGTSEITRVSEGCAVREQWLSAGGQEGTSLHYYDRSDHEWHQDWVGADGTILHLHGGLKDGAMVLTDDVAGAKPSVISRITYTPLPDKKVKQEWTLSKDQGKTWQTSFLGIYETLSD